MNDLEKALIGEIDMNLDSIFDGESVEVKEEVKLKIAQEIINEEDSLWEMLNDIINEKIYQYADERITELENEIDYENRRAECCGTDTNDYYHLEELKEELEKWSSI